MPKLPLPPWLIDRLSSPVATAAALTLGLKVGQEASKLKSGEISPEEFKRRAGSHVGTITGTMAGALAGSVIGRWLPGFGTLAGAFGGGLMGQMVGEHLTQKGADRIEPIVRRDEEADEAPQASEATQEAEAPQETGAPRHLEPAEGEASAPAPLEPPPVRDL